jgi:hypothetical protein
MTQDSSTVYVGLSAPSNPDNYGTSLTHKTNTIHPTEVKSFVVDYLSNPSAPANIYMVQSKPEGTDAGPKLGELLLNKMTNAGVNTGTSGMSLLHKHGTGADVYDENPNNYFYPYYQEGGGYGFGDGQQIAIEYAPDGTYIWMNWNSPAVNLATSLDGGKWDVSGMGLCRVKFVEGASLKADDVAVQTLDLTKLALQTAQLGMWDTGMKYVSVSIDNVNKRLAVFYTSPTDNNVLKVAIYSYDYNNYANTVNSINFTYIKTITVPRVSWWLARANGDCSSEVSNLPIQGWALFGDFLYFGHGSAYFTASGSTYGQQKFFSPSTIGGTYFDGTSVDKVGNMHVSRYNWQTKTLIEEFHTEVAKSYTHRELNGMFIVPTVINGIVRKLELHMGITDGDSSQWNWSIYNKVDSIAYQNSGMENTLLDIAASSFAMNNNNQGTLFEETTLITTTIPQSLAIDTKAVPGDVKLYISQLKTGSTDGGSQTGEFIINELSSNGVNTGIMTFNHDHDASGAYTSVPNRDDATKTVYLEKNGVGFGHGSEAIEYAPDGTYIWIETKSPVVARSITPSGEDVFGTALARIKFVNGSTVTPSSAAVQNVDLVKLGLSNAKYDMFNASIDNVNRLLGVMYIDNNDSGKLKIAIFQYDYDAYDGTPNSINYTKLKTMTVPWKQWWKANTDGTCSTTVVNHILNGWTLFGNYIYVGWSTAYWATAGSSNGQADFFSPSAVGGTYGDGTSVTKVGNTVLQSFDWNTGVLKKENHTEAAKSLVYRELEGFAMIPTVVNDKITHLKLCFGFAGGITGARNWSVMTKDSDIL